jgi:hypothetical protein
MKIFLGQIYIKPGISFPLSLRFQQWLGDELSQRVEISEAFSRTYSEDFGLGIRISAKADIAEPEIKGPTIFKRPRNVEFTVFLPYEARDCYDGEASRKIIQLILQSATRILEHVGLDATKVRDDSPALLAAFLARPEFITHSPTQEPQ